MFIKTGISILVVSALALAACSDDVPPPKPAPKPAAAAPAAAPAPSPAPAAPKAAEAPKPSPDQALAARVKQALEGEARIHAAALDVTASGGKVTLWGTAASDDERERAARVAGKVDGVTSVDNQIKVVRGS